MMKITIQQVKDLLKAMEDNNCNECYLDMYFDENSCDYIDFDMYKGNHFDKIALTIVD